MKGPEQLQKNEGRWETRMGLCFPGERVVFRGRDLHAELGDMSWIELFLYGITGRRFSGPELKILNAIWVYTSYPDPRVWNNRVMSLAGTARSTAALALSAATAVSEATVYGGRAVLAAAEVLRRAGEWVERGADLGSFVEDELRRHRRVAGFGRPGVRADERIQPMYELLLDQGVADKTYVQLVFAIERLLIERGRLRMNFAGLCAAVTKDLGFSAREYYHFVLLCFSAGMLPCYLEAQQKTEGGFLPLSCSAVRYEGGARRNWPP